MSPELLAETTTFVVMLVLIVCQGWPRLLRVAEVRQDRIAAVLAEAHTVRSEVGVALEEARKQVDAARQQAERIHEQAHKAVEDEARDASIRAEREAEAFLVQLKGQIDAERRRAIAELRREVSSVVVDAAGRALGRALTAQGQAELIGASLGKMVPHGGGGE